MKLGLNKKQKKKKHDFRYLIKKEIKLILFFVLMVMFQKYKTLILI